MGFLPYVDVTSYPSFPIESVPVVKDFTLGFVVADGNNNPSWGGYYPTTTGFYRSSIEKVREKGGDVIVSFGGQKGRDLSSVCNTHVELFQKYDEVIQKYDFKKVDFDIEGDLINNKSASEKRADAIRMLLKKYPKLSVSLTLPVNELGLSLKALDIVRNTQCDIVNIMTMNYGNGKGRMGQYAINAAKSVRAQTGKKIGITVMIGRNDVQGEIFTLNDARMVKKFVDSNSWVVRLSMWSINRDNGNKISLEKSSMIDQEKWEFSKIFNK
jgi:hypothetical protein